MAVTTNPIDVGAAPNDGTGDPARTGGQTVNTNFSNIDAAVEELQSENWEIDNTSETLALGEKVIANSHAGITKTLPAVAALSTTDFNSIWILNADDAQNVSIDPDGTEELFVRGTSQGAGTTYDLGPGEMAIAVYRAAGDWNLFVFGLQDSYQLTDLTDVNTSTATSGNVLQADGVDWESVTKEAADIVDRLIPALETTPYLKHETRAARSSGTETITCADDPSVYLPIGGNNVTINLDVPALSLPVRGLNDVKLAGKVFVKMNGAYTGLTVTTDAGTKLATFPKGTAPSANAEYAILVWEWFDDGTTDFMWAEWVNDS